ncbi:MAG: HEAT repeat domain-containing protein, partial [Actinomycetota bacterium]|nr:HEAT repeat domain-containing protein [Actinomycetota bacterium]
MTEGSLSGLTLQELISIFDGAPPSGPDYAVSFYDDVAAAIGNHGDRGVRVLLDRLGNTEDVARLHGALVGITVRPLPTDQSVDVLPLLVSMLRHPDPLIVTAAIDALAALGCSTIAKQVQALSRHPNPYVRASAVRYIAQILPDIGIAVALEALHDEHHSVRSTAIDQLGELGAIET